MGLGLDARQAAVVLPLEAVQPGGPVPAAWLQGLEDGDARQPPPRPGEGRRSRQETPMAGPPVARGRQSAPRYRRVAERPDGARWCPGLLAAPGGGALQPGWRASTG